jgi:hypothetical protein
VRLDLDGSLLSRSERGGRSSSLPIPSAFEATEKTPNHHLLPLSLLDTQGPLILYFLLSKASSYQFAVGFLLSKKIIADFVFTKISSNTCSHRSVSLAGINRYQNGGIQHE